MLTVELTLVLISLWTEPRQLRLAAQSPSRISTMCLEGFLVARSVELRAADSEELAGYHFHIDMQLVRLSTMIEFIFALIVRLKKVLL